MQQSAKREGKKKGDEQQQQQQSSRGAMKENNDRISQVECFTCHALWQYSNKCPTKKTAEENDDEDNRHAHATWDASTFVTYQVK
jgi:hypothetical protein